MGVEPSSARDFTRTPSFLCVFGRSLIKFEQKVINCPHCGKIISKDFLNGDYVRPEVTCPECGSHNTRSFAYVGSARCSTNAKNAVASYKSKHKFKSKSYGMAKELEVFLSDLRPEAQARVLRFLKIKTAVEANLDVFPLFVLPEPNQ